MRSMTAKELDSEDLAVNQGQLYLAQGTAAPPGFLALLEDVKMQVMLMEADMHNLRAQCEGLTAHANLTPDHLEGLECQVRHAKGIAEHAALGLDIVLTKELSLVGAAEDLGTAQVFSLDDQSSEPDGTLLGNSDLCELLPTEVAHEQHGDEKEAGLDFKEVERNEEIDEPDCGAGAFDSGAKFVIQLLRPGASLVEAESAYADQSIAVFLPDAHLVNHGLASLRLAMGDEHCKTSTANDAAAFSECDRRHWLQT